MFQRIQVRPLIGSLWLTLLMVILVEWLFCSFLYFISQQQQVFSITFYYQQPGEIFAQAAKQEPFVDGQIVLGILALFLLIWLYNKLKGKNFNEAASYGAYGTARFAKRREVFNNQMFAKETWNRSGQSNLKNPSGLIFGLLKDKPLILPEETKVPNRNVFVVGSPGAGKTQSYILTNMIHEQQRSIVVTDPKGEIFESTALLKKRQGYDVRLINFKEMNISERYNPLDYITREADAEQVATTLVLNAQEEQRTDFWTKAEIALLKTLLLYVKYECHGEKTMAKVNELLTNYGVSHQKMDQLFDKLAPNHPAVLSYGIVRMAKDTVRMSIFTSLAMTISKFVGEEVRAFTSQSDFQLDEIGKRKMILYVILPVADTTWEPLISTFFTQLFQRLYHVADQHFNRLPIAVNLLLDEFPNLGKIPNYEEILATCRGYRISISTIVQSLGQLIDKYQSQEKAESIVGNCSLRYLLGVGDKLTAEYFSELMGKTTVGTFSTSPNKGFQRDSTTHSYSERHLLTPDELTRMKRDEAMLLVTGMFPIRLTKAYQFRFFKGILDSRMQTSRFDYNRTTIGVEEPQIMVVASEEAEEEESLYLTQLEEELTAIESGASYMADVNAVFTSTGVPNQHLAVKLIYQ